MMGLQSPLKSDGILNMEILAADESIASGLYICWKPSPYATIPASAADEIKSGIGQCCRVGSISLCRCGHTLAEHQSVKKVKRGFIKPPTCAKCRRCPGFTYSPSFPSETGQPWLLRRKVFNIQEWRQVKIEK
jgi:hypothetical protein